MLVILLLPKNKLVGGKGIHPIRGKGTVSERKLGCCTGMGLGNDDGWKESRVGKMG